MAVMTGGHACNTQYTVLPALETFPIVHPPFNRITAPCRNSATDILELKMNERQPNKLNRRSPNAVT